MDPNEEVQEEFQMPETKLVDWCIVDEEGMIENVIVCEEGDEAFPASIGAKPFYEGAGIGMKYDPPPPPAPLEDQVASLQRTVAQQEKTINLQANQIKANSDRQEFLEDCIAEMAGEVYAV